MRILFAKTYEDSARVIKRILVAAGHEVRTVNELADAHAVLRTEAFDLLLLGGIGPRGLNAWDYMPELRREFDLPAIVLSGYGQPDEIQRSLDVGFAEHVVMPISPSMLLAAIERVARLSSS